ncbi:hypothetical protein EAE96_007562 [Botrytis aclada]|nr:hypothetical protein EAE96_007562 [Botrytis aclada]
MALLITPTSATATITVTKTLYDIVSLTTLSTVVSPSPTANIADVTPTFPTNDTTSTFSPFASLTNNSSNITTSNPTKTHHGSNSWWMPLLFLPIVAFSVIVWATLSLVASKTKSPWLDFLRYDVNSQVCAEREFREAEIKEQLRKIDEQEAAYMKKIKDDDQDQADFHRIIRFHFRALNTPLAGDEVHIRDDYARFEDTN